MSKRAIIIVDLQNDYLASGRFPLVGIDEAITKAAEVTAAARHTQDLVIHVRHESPEGSPFFVAGTDGADIVSAMAPAEGEPVITKTHPNAFRETGLATVLKTAGIGTVTIVGAMSHMCIDATARAASDLGYKTTVIEDACATRDLEFGGETVAAVKVHAAFMAALAFGYAEVTSAERYLSSLRESI